MPQVFSSRVFFSFLVCTFISVLCEIIECAMFVYMDRSFFILRRISQSFYAASVLVCTFSIALYVYSKISIERRASFKIISILGIPMIAGIISLFVDRIYYARNAYGYYYNYGSVVDFCYAMGVIYVVSSLIAVTLRKNYMKAEESKIISVGLVLWLILGAVQYTAHGYQVTSVGMMLMALVLFLSSENPREYYERELYNVKNRAAFTLVLEEKFGLKKHFFISSVIFTGKTKVLSGEDRQMLGHLQERVARMAESRIRQSAFLSEWNTLSFVLSEPSKVEELMTLINNFKDDSSNYKLTYSVLEIPKYTDNVDEAYQILNYVSGDYIYTQSSPNLVVDDKIVDKMRYRNTIEDVVRQAVKEKAFEVYYQPILSVKEQAFVSAEALVRLRRPDDTNFISPEDFVPVAEQCGLIQEIDDLVFEKVCSFIARENLSSYGIRTVEVNLSGNEVVDRATYSRLLTKMEKYHIPPKFINFEITETAYINNDDMFKENVQKLKEMGSTFSMDDFGSGYSNLLELLKMDYKLVKMDKEFIWNCLDPERPDNMRMLEYSISFLKDYGLHVLAEGVENIEMAKILIEKGVEYLQGFYYSRPIPEKEYIEFLKAQKGDRL